MEAVTKEVVEENGVEWLVQTVDLSQLEFTSSEGVAEEKFLLPEYLDEMTGDRDPEECTHEPHKEIKAKRPDDRHEASYCMYCGDRLYVG